MKNILSYEDASQFVEKMYPMAILDRNGRYIYANPSWFKSQVKGQQLNADEVLGRHVLDLIPDSKATYVLETGKPLIGEYIEGSGTFTSYIPRVDKDGCLNGVFIYVIVPELVQAMALTQRINHLNNELEFYKNELQKERAAKYDLKHIIGESTPMKKLKREIGQAANTVSTVLIEGETGTGKELVAHAIHEQSTRRKKNFIRVNCAAIPPELMESEFFGYASGAFTGASKKGKLGKFQLADQGTLFLDEVNLLPATMQPKFLRVLQEREVDPVGGESSIPVNVRVIAATNRPLEELVDAGEFRQDLYFRLNVMKAHIPPLRERKEDIPLLVEHLIVRLNKQLDTFIDGVHPEVIELFYQYDWPGNIRELQNMLERAMNLSRSSILTLDEFDYLLERLNCPRTYPSVKMSPPDNFRLNKADYEAQLIEQALEEAGGNKTQAAKALNISRNTLYKKLRK